MKQTLRIMVSAIALSLMAAPSLSFAMGKSAPRSVKSQPQAAPGVVLGRIVEATCNTEYGLGELTLAVYDTESQTMTRQSFNVVDPKVCSTDGSHPFSTSGGSPLAALAFNQLLGLDDSSNSFVTLTEVRVNANKIITSVKMVNVEGDAKLSEIYHKFNLLGVSNYPFIDNKYFITVGIIKYYPDAEERVKKIFELSKAE
jgi:hypothetical protein